MNLQEKIKVFYKQEYSIPDINSVNMFRKIDGLNYNFSASEYNKYLRLYDLMRNIQFQFSEDLAVLFIKGSEFPANEEFIKFIKRYMDNENKLQMFFTNYAKKEDAVAKRINVGNRFVEPIYTKNFLKKALEHKLICENKKLWKNPDTSMQHLRFLSAVTNRLSYLEENLDEKILLLEFNNMILQKKGDSTKVEYDSGFNLTRRLFECNANLSICHFEKGDIIESKEYMNCALDHIKELNLNIDKTHNSLLYPLHLCIDKLNEILNKNPEIFSEQLYTNKISKIKTRLDRRFKEEMLIA